jgi:TP901 family phage tail tape measure protein
MARALGVNIVSTFDSKGIRKAINDFKKLEGAGNKATFALRTIDSAAKNMSKSLAKVGAGVAVFAGLAVKSFASFDDAMTQSTAIMGNLSDDMKNKMSDAAREMARTTTFSATEAAKSFYFLASAGLDAESSIMALPKVAKFAQAGMFDMALATDLLTDAQSALGLTIRNDAVANMNNMVRVSDVLVKANTLANASVEQFSSALTNKAGAAMKAVGMDIEEGVAVLAAFADQGIKSEESGTQFGIVLRDLQTKALANTEQFAKYGVTVFDSSGELRNMADIIADVEGALKGQSDATKKQTLLEMGFSDKSVASMMALIGTSESIRSYEEQLRLASGTTEEIAAKQLTSLSAQLKIAKNNLNDVAITIGEKLAPFVRAMAIIFQNFGKIVGEEGVGAGLKYLGGEFLNATANMGTFGNVMLGLISLFVALRLVAIAATISQNLFHVALLNNPIGRVVALFIVLGTAVVAAYLKFEGFRKVVNAVINFVIGGVENMVNKWIKALNIFIKALNFFRPLLGKLGINFEEIGERGAVSFGRIGNAANKASDKIFKTIDAIQAAKNAERRGGGLPTVSGSGDDDIIVGGAGSGGGGQSPIEKAKQALEKYIDAVKGLTSAQKSLRDANKGVNQSNETLLEKTKALTEAQRKFNLVTKGYGADSKEAKDADKERTKAERAAERAKYALEQAVFAVSDAEKDLAEIRKDPKATPKMIREAEIRLAESKLRVADATDEQVESSDALVASQNRLNEAVNGAKEGSDAYNEALKELADAEKDQRSAIDARTEAYERQAEAVEKLADAERDRIAAGKGVPKSDRAAVDASVPSVVAGVVAPVVDAIGRAIDVIPAPVAADAEVATTFAGSMSNIAEQTAVSRGFITQDQADALFARRATPFANGGIVTKAMLGMVGEAGAEAIIPLDRLGSFGSTYNIQVTAGMGADGKDIGTQIVNALKRYERTNGALPLTVQ